MSCFNVMSENETILLNQQCISSREFANVG